MQHWISTLIVYSGRFFHGVEISISHLLGYRSVYLKNNTSGLVFSENNMAYIKVTWCYSRDAFWETVDHGEMNAHSFVKKPRGGEESRNLRSPPTIGIGYGTRILKSVFSPLSPFSTRRLFSREATFSFVGVSYHISKCDADKGKSRFARKKSPSGKRALRETFAEREYLASFVGVLCVGPREDPDIGRNKKKEEGYVKWHDAV